ncbi:MAG: MGH1-like glycoside hydrolase domain-containing protein [Casimicrobium sp.]
MAVLSKARIEEARNILRNNDRGGYTIPTQGLYPFQWNWDASICALGWHTFDEARAWREFEFLLSGIWKEAPQSGLLGHIIFHQEADTYFPGPDEWGTIGKRTPPTSSISQPPVHATILLQMFERSRDGALAKEKVRSFLPALVAHHRWWYRDRDPKQTGLVVNLHPWETGMDNSPAWDDALANVPPATRSFKRKDLSHVDPAMRPKQSDYDRYVYLMDLQRECEFDIETIFAKTPYAVNDIGIISILHRATECLIDLCKTFGMNEEANELSAYRTRTANAIEKLWNPSLGQFVSFDLKANRQLEVATHAGLLPLHGFAEQRHLNTLLATLERWLDETPFAIPSTRSTSERFEAMRYWRGPIWLHINWMIAEGSGWQGSLERFHHRIRERTIEMVNAHGFCEYYHPLTGAGLGGRAFSWAAATALCWLADA